jgi:hypothetical protein
MRNEIIKINDEAYFSSEGLSNSFLIAFDRSPAHAFVHKESNAMKLGTLIHQHILENDYNKYIVIDKINKNTNEYKNKVKDNPDKIVLFNEEFDELEQIKNNVCGYKWYEDITLGEILLTSRNELALYWSMKFQDTEIQCKGKIDILDESDKEHPIIFDLKKTTNCMNFWKSVKDYKYYRQAYWYCNGYFQLTGIIPRFIFITVEDEAPYGVKCYELDNDYIFRGEIESTKSIMNYLKWNGEKTLYKNGVEIIEMPNYMKED